MTKYIQRPTTFPKKNPLTRGPLTLRGLNVLLLSIIILVGIGYIVQINTRATSGFVMNDLEKEISVLSEQHRDLELKIAELQSFQSIRDAVQELGLVTTSDKEYLTTSTGAVALDQ